MTTKQRHARNEAFQLLKIAERILRTAGLTDYAAQIAACTAGIQRDARLMEAQEVQRRTAAQ